MGDINFSETEYSYTAKHAKIADHHLDWLEKCYEDKGICFYNDYFEDDAVMEWEDSVDPNVVAEAKCDFTNCLSKC